MSAQFGFEPPYHVFSFDAVFVVVLIRFVF